MKIITVIADGAGRLHVAATRAPDLARREIAARTGSGELVWCGVPPTGIGAKSVVSQLEQRFEDALVAPGVFQTDPSRLLRAIHRLTVVVPKREARRQAFARVIRPVGRMLRIRKALPILATRIGSN